MSVVLILRSWMLLREVDRAVIHKTFKRIVVLASGASEAVFGTAIQKLEMIEKALPSTYAVMQATVRQVWDAHTQSFGLELADGGRVEEND